MQEKSALTPFSCHQNPRMPGSIANGFTEFITAVADKSFSGWFLLWRTNLHDQVAAWCQMVGSAGDEPVEHREAAGTAIEGQMRLEIPNASREILQFLVRDVGRITEDKIELL